LDHPSQFVWLFIVINSLRTQTADRSPDTDCTDAPLAISRSSKALRFFHGYYDCYCYLPLYALCGRDLLVAKLRPASMDAAAGAVEEVARHVAHIRRRWEPVQALRSHRQPLRYLFGSSSSMRRHTTPERMNCSR
jgi:hypothetical protein